LKIDSVNSSYRLSAAKPIATLRILAKITGSTLNKVEAKLQHDHCVELTVKKKEPPGDNVAMIKCSYPPGGGRGVMGFAHARPISA
jgi:hypothetical protein